ncbi:hypothetical protein P3S67_011869 [Capsicum chacoense]
MLNSNIVVTSCSISLRWLVYGFLAGPPHNTKSKEGLVVSNKDIESDIMDETKSQENESLRKEVRRLRQQMIEMHRAWASGLPPPSFPFIDPTNTLKFIPIQKHLNTSTSFSLAPQHKPATFTTSHVVCDLVAQSSTGTSTLARPTVIHPHAASELIFNTFGDHCYTLEPAFKLTEPPKFLNKKSSVLEELEKMVGKMKSAENAMKNSLGPTGKEDVSLTQYTYCQAQSRAYISNTLTHLQQGASFQNTKSFIPLPQCPLNNAQLFTHPPSYPQWNAPVPQHHPQPPQIYQGTSKSMFYPRTELAMMRKEKDNFTPIGESYASLFQRLVQQGMITPLLGYTPDPHSRSFDLNVRCIYHSDVQGNSIENCRALKREIEKMIQDKSIMVQNINSEESSSHADMQTSG